MSNVPVMGSTFLFGYVSAIKMLSTYKQTLLDGYVKFNKHAFQIPGLLGWVVFVSSDLYDDVRKARDDSLSMVEASKDNFAFQYTLGQNVVNDAWHNSVVRKQMTQNLGAKFPEISDEIATALEDGLNLSADDDWKSIDAHDLLEEIICRTSNRLFIGLPLCRNPEYTKISREFSITVIQSGLLINLFPSFLRPLVARYVSPAPKAIKGFEKYMVPIIEERWRLERELGDAWADKKPNDFLQWMMDDRTGSQRDARDLTTRMLTLTFASTHTTTMSLTHVLYWLAAKPEHVPALREEVGRAIELHGWTRAAINDMHKLDSFIKESTRCSALMAMGMPRKAMRDVTLSDGTLVPKGAKLAINIPAVYSDPSLFPTPETFDPWRSSRKIEQGENEVKHALTTASSDFLLWGGGEHVCAGRYLAAQEMKTILAHILLNYEIKFAGLPAGVRPKDKWVAYSCLPDLKARVLFRRRQS
ncbi:cytochrome P450 [Calocera viscosa TUFC12733]|uniref:Cytochrome P450 n=1 Tax=Calocera viscosa (strain TUFC12733) TaxID=1330018 RepID=A0A167K921_CALVF|nr:cytochrome P450 [Calocera viscosa TUFC12733]